MALGKSSRLGPHPWRTRESFGLRFRATSITPMPIRTMVATINMPFCYDLFVGVSNSAC